MTTDDAYPGRTVGSRIFYTGEGDAVDVEPTSIEDLAGVVAERLER